MNEFLWALAAFALLGLLLMLGEGKRRNNLRFSGFIGLEDLIEGGFYIVVVMILLLPLYPLYLLGVAAWRVGGRDTVCSSKPGKISSLAEDRLDFYARLCYTVTKALCFPK